MLLGKATVPGLALLGFAMLFSSAPPCKAQEVNPDHFTATGVEGFSEQTQPAVKKNVHNAQVAQKSAPAPQVKQASLTEAVVHPRKSSKASARKTATPPSQK